MTKTNTESSSWVTYLRLLGLIKPYLVIFSIGIAGTILASATDATIAYLVKPLVNMGLVAHDMTLLKWLPILIIVIFCARGIMNFVSTYFINRVGRSIVMDFRQHIFAHLLRLPASFFDQQSSGKLLSLIVYNVEQVASATTDALLVVIQQSFLAIGLVVVMFIISWKLTLLFMAVAPVVGGIVHITTKRLKRLSLTVQQSVGDVTHIARECIDGWMVVRTFGGEEYEKNKFNKAAKLNRHRELKVVVTNALGTSAVQILVAVPLALVVLIINVLHLQVSVGSFVALIVAILQLLTPMRRLTKINTEIQKGVAGAESIFELLDIPSELDNGTLPVSRVNGRIQFQQVNFHYPATSRQILHNIDFIVEPGEVVAIVGHTGSGKSTLVSLLPKFYEVDSGKILIDNNNINEYHLADLRQQFSFVSQHITLFNDTVARNIAYAKAESVDLDMLVNAASASYILDDINRLPYGFDTVIGENGVTLSGGQRQRLAIARAILKDAPILILDEATSSLDTKSERILQAALEKLMLKRTTLVIAHRLSTVENADRIIVLDNGKIVEQGTHRELLGLDGYYAKLYKIQFSNK